MRVTLIVSELQKHVSFLSNFTFYKWCVTKVAHCIRVIYVSQGSQRLEKYLNIQDCLEKSSKIKYALKSTGKSHECLEKSLNSSI